MLAKFRKLVILLRMHRQIARIVINCVHMLESRAQCGIFWGSVSEEEGRALIDLTQKASTLPGPIMEIGALFGFTTQLLATYKPAEKKLIAVECFAWNPFGLSVEDHREFIHRVLRYNLTHSNTSIFAGTSRDFYRTYQGERPAMVFIDAGHFYEGVKEDIDWAVQMKIPVIAGHDYSELWPEVRRAVDEAFQGEIAVKGSVWWHCNLSESPR